MEIPGKLVFVFVLLIFAGILYYCKSDSGTKKDIHKLLFDKFLLAGILIILGYLTTPVYQKYQETREFKFQAKLENLKEMRTNYFNASKSLYVYLAGFLDPPKKKEQKTEDFKIFTDNRNELAISVYKMNVYFENKEYYNKILAINKILTAFYTMDKSKLDSQKVGDYLPFIRGLQKSFDFYYLGLLDEEEKPNPSILEVVPTKAADSEEKENLNQLNETFKEWQNFSSVVGGSNSK